MGKQHQVQDNETLLSIANQNGFWTEQPVKDANPELANKCLQNMDVLPPGTFLDIPDLRKRAEDAATATVHIYQLVTAYKDLVITIQAPDGMKLKSGDATYSLSFTADGKKQTEKGDLSSGSFRIEYWPVQVKEAELTVSLRYNKRVEEVVPEGVGADGRIYRLEKIKLHVGGLDPLVGSEKDRGKAVLKILKNLGFYTGDVGNDLSKDQCQAAIRKFQQIQKITPAPSNLLDEETVHRLVAEQQNRIGSSGPPLRCSAHDRDLPLEVGSAAAVNDEYVSSFSKYLEPTDLNQHPSNRKKFKEFRYFPREAYVAPCDPGSADNPNVIRMKTRRFIFLDSGRWLAEARDFSMIWGRHVYRCEYTRGGNAVPAGDEGRLDVQFFKGMKGRVNVAQVATASWAPQHEFDWNRLVFIIPDMHLMTGETGGIWRDKYLLDPELDLLDFANRLSGIGGLRGKTKVIQIGDSYDLWVACAPRYFSKNPDIAVEILEDKDQRWNCGGSHCDGHKSRLEPCPPKWNRFWTCDVVPCRGHLNPGEICEVDQFARWSCRRDKPPCPNDHLNSIESCPDASVVPGAAWFCRKTEPPCPGHPKRSERCPDQIHAIDQLATWIHEIQGMRDNWVRELLERRASLNALPAGVTLEDLESDLRTAAGRAIRWLNPAERALRRMAEHCGLEYIHGNHDDYLLRRSVTDRAGIPKRESLWEADGIFIEHAHRMENVLIGSGNPFPTNYDGSVTGYEATMDYYRDRKAVVDGQKRNWLERASDYLGPFKITAADWFAQNFQQNQYWGELAQVWIGRHSFEGPKLKPPHVCAIGHTHKPMLAYINIDFAKFF